MLGQKEICGLIVVLGCSLVHAACIPFDVCFNVLVDNAKKLENATKAFVDISSHLTYNHTQLPPCNASQNEAGPIISDFHTLFKNLSEAIDGAHEIENLRKILQQQQQCLQDWNVTRSPFTIPVHEKDQTGKKIFLIKASECYSQLMQKLKDDMEAEAMNGSS